MQSFPRTAAMPLRPLPDRQKMKLLIPELLKVIQRILSVFIRNHLPHSLYYAAGVPAENTGNGTLEGK
jgi:hypothetical protein